MPQIRVQDERFYHHTNYACRLQVVIIKNFGHILIVAPSLPKVPNDA